MLKVNTKNKLPIFPPWTALFFFEGEVSKLQQHLVLLREEYVKLQQRYKTLERNYNILNVTTKLDQDSFVCRLLKTIADLFNRELYR